MRRPGPSLTCAAFAVHGGGLHVVLEQEDQQEAVVRADQVVVDHHVEAHLGGGVPGATTSAVTRKTLTTSG